MAMFSLRSERFCAVYFFRSKDKERESRTAQKMVQVKEREVGGEERKETLADKPQDFENHPLDLSCLSLRHDILMHSSAVVIDQ